MSSWIKTVGTQTGEFQLGFDGPKLKGDSGNLVIRDGANSTFVNITAGNVVSNGTFQGNAAGLTSIPGANVTGFVANASIANVANLAYSVSGANVSGAVSFATTANSVAGANVSGAVANAGYATIAGTAYSVSAANIVGTVNLANFATTANAVAGANVTGTVASASLATFATTANAVAGANVSGEVSFAATANAVAGSNVSGQVGNALVAGTVYTAAQPAITSVGTLTSLSLGGAVTGNIIPSANVTYNLGNATNRFKDLYLSGSTINLGDANISAVGNSIALQGANITGGLNVSGDATVGGNLSITGNLTYINVVDLRVQDPIIELGGGPNGAPLTNNDGMDRGQILHYFTGSAPVDAFIGWKNSNAEFQFGSNVTTNNNVVTVNTLGNIRVNTVIGNLNGVATFATTANAVAGANVSGTVANATFATTSGTTNSVAGANVSGTVANATFATTSGSTNSVAGANVSGTVANATFATSAGSATTADSATTAGTVTTGAQPNITSVGTLTSLAVSGTTNLGPVGNLTLTGGSAGYILSTNGSGSLTWIATPSSADSWKATSVALTSASTSTVNVLTLPASAIVDKVSVVVDTAFNGTSPTVTVGISGGTGFEYANSTDINLKSADRFDMPSQLAPVGSSRSIQAYFTASGATTGSARIIVTYAIPS